MVSEGTDIACSRNDVSPAGYATFSRFLVTEFNRKNERTNERKKSKEMQCKSFLSLQPLLHMLVSLGAKTVVSSAREETLRV